MKRKRSTRNRVLLLIFITAVTMSCLNLPQISLPTPVPTFDSSTLVSQISVKESSQWLLKQMESPILKPPPQNSPQLVIGLDGRLHLFWDTLGGADAFIYHSYLEDGYWSEPFPISLSLGTSKLYVSPVVSPDGVIHVLWKNDLKLGGPYRLLYAQFDGVSWSEESEVYVSEKDVNIWGELFFDEQSVIHAIVKASNGINSDLFYLTLNSNNWQSSGSITPKTGLDGLVTWQYKPFYSGIVLLYGRDLNRDLRFSSWEAGENGDITKANIHLPIYTDYFVDSFGNYYVYWTGQVPVPGGATTGAYYQCIDTNLHPWSEAVLSGEKTVITKPLIAQTQSASVMAWINRDDTIEFLFPNGCESANVYSLVLPESTTQK
ncbi:MAG: hypothetical protein HN855_06375 [Anaerolineae bacterium]|jgi:hypothetical protein|nr:hypothetical protein [Anaerolineae bacterium]MBT7071810.1 hypothetical protein [Anaerolineae bacterium]MBT7324763.1 hypothetical protein [Anaerolineae bacterium]